ncbi:YcgL domain-containing protein [Bowmanella denitrificans]|uniref:YcgL domain-containing protein GCM10009092_20720 n=1 Tax=Bowmanella denitrificans TaxID=366582 RepID=A0ABN0X6H0_9ALTE
MLCAIYKSSKKDETYLFVPKRDDFSDVPQALMQHFGTPSLVMVMAIKPDSKLAIGDAAKVCQAMQEQGFYLQLPPPKENLLETHRRQLHQTKEQDDV